jgi:2',3'-cyclic-nucleotide 2'-phosphodiesterase/3'-nucleotidase
LRKDADVIVISPSEGAEENAEIRALRTPYFDATRNFLNKPIGMTTGEFYGGMQARVVDSAVADLINEAQKWAAKKYASLDVDLSIAAIFLSNNGLPKGSLRLKDAFGIYNFDNTLYIVEMSGKTLREALEQNARYFGTLNGSALPESVDLCKANNPPVADYLWDLYSDIDYTLDVTREPGKRVTQLRYKGKDVVDGDTFKVAMNNYRAGGGGFPQFAGLKLLWQGADCIRDYVAQFIEEKSAAAGGAGTGPVGLDPNTINVCNFTLVPNIYSKYFPSMPVKCSP